MFNHREAPQISGAEHVNFKATDDRHEFFKVSWSPLDAVDGLGGVNGKVAQAITPILFLSDPDNWSAPLLEDNRLIAGFHSLRTAVKAGEIKVHRRSLLNIRPDSESRLNWFISPDDFTRPMTRINEIIGKRVELVERDSEKDSSRRLSYVKIKLFPRLMKNGLVTLAELNSEWRYQTPDDIELAISTIGDGIYQVRIPGTDTSKAKGAPVIDRVNEILKQNPDWLVTSLTEFLLTLSTPGLHLNIWIPVADRFETKAFGAELVDTSLLDLIA